MIIMTVATTTWTLPAVGWKYLLKCQLVWTHLVRRCGEQNSTSTRDYGLRSTDQINNDSNTHDIWQNSDTHLCITTNAFTSRIHISYFHFRCCLFDDGPSLSFLSYLRHFQYLDRLDLLRYSLIYLWYLKIGISENQWISVNISEYLSRSSLPKYWKWRR